MTAPVGRGVTYSTDSDFPGTGVLFVNLGKQIELEISNKKCSQVLGRVCCKEFSSFLPIRECEVAFWSEN